MDHIERVNMLVTLRRYPLAEEAAREGLKEQPDSPTLHALLAVALMEQKRFKESRDAVAEAIRLAPEDSYGFYVAALLEVDMERWDYAEDALAEALRLDPTEARSYGLQAFLLARRDDWRGSMKAAELGLQQDPEHESCLCRLGLAQWNAGEQKKARATFALALRHHPESGYVHYMSGLTYLAQAESDRAEKETFQGAIEHFGQSLRYWPENDDSRDSLQRILLKRLKKRLGHAVGAVIVLLFLAGVAASKWDMAVNPDFVIRSVLFPLGLLLAAAAVLIELKPVCLSLLRWDRLGRATLTERQRQQGGLVLAAYLLVLSAVGGSLFAWSFWPLLAVPLVCFALPMALALQLREPWGRLGPETALFALGLVWLLALAGKLVGLFTWPPVVAIGVIVAGVAIAVFALERLHAWLWPKAAE